MIQHREQQLRELIKTANLDAIVLMSPENFAYGSGLNIFTVEMIRSRQAFVIIPRTGAPEMVLCSIEVTFARNEGWTDSIQPYTEFQDSPIEVLADRLSALGLSSGRIGIDGDYLPLSSYQQLIKRLPRLELVNTTGQVASVRAVKTVEEVEFVEASTKATHAAVLHAMEQSKLGESERTMCNRIVTGMIERGADGTAFVCFSSGDRTRMAHAIASARIPNESEIIRFDLGGLYGSYMSDFARTYSTGNPTPLQRQTHAALVRVQREAIAAVQPGVTAEDIYYATRNAFENHGLNFQMTLVGHSFGVELHEPPVLRPGDRTKLEVGMILNIEPATADETGTKYHTEDLIEVTQQGARLMTLGLAPEEIPTIGQSVSSFSASGM